METDLVVRLILVLVFFSIIAWMVWEFLHGIL